MNGATNRKAARLMLAALVTLSVLAVGATKAAAAPAANMCLDCEGYSFTFGETVDPWRGASFYEQPGGDYLELLQPALTLGRTGKNGFALLSSNGAAGVWMYARFKGSRTHLSLGFDAENVDNGGRLAPIVYIGKSAPKTIYQFEMLGHPLNKGSQTVYKYLDLKEAGLKGEEIVIAIGYVNLDRERVPQSALIDNIRILLHEGD